MDETNTVEPIDGIHLDIKYKYRFKYIYMVFNMNIMEFI